jgi:hypothetical protein
MTLTAPSNRLEMERFKPTVVNRKRRFRINIDQDVGIAVGTIIAACARAKQGGVNHTALAPGALVFAKPVNDFLPVHGFLQRRLAWNDRRVAIGQALWGAGSTDWVSGPIAQADCRFPGIEFRRPLTQSPILVDSID